MQKIQFDYFTGMEAEQYSFYRVPKVLFTEPCFKALSCEATVKGNIGTAGTGRKGDFYFGTVYGISEYHVQVP